MLIPLKIAALPVPTFERRPKACYTNVPVVPTVTPAYSMRKTIDNPPQFNVRTDVVTLGELSAASTSELSDRTDALVHEEITSHPTTSNDRVETLTSDNVSSRMEGLRRPATSSNESPNSATVRL